MQQTIQFEGYAGSIQPVDACSARQSRTFPHVGEMIGKVRNVASKWLHARSRTFSDLCGEDFTHQEVITAHAAFVLLIAGCIAASWLEGGAL